MKSHSKRALLKKYNINADKMREMMKPKVKTIVKNGSAERRITEEEAILLLEIKLKKRQSLIKKFSNEFLGFNQISW